MTLSSTGLLTIDSSNETLAGGKHQVKVVATLNDELKTKAEVIFDIEYQLNPELVKENECKISIE